MSGVLRGFAPAACKEAALDVHKVRLGRKPLCGLAHQKNPSFMHWKLLSAKVDLWMGAS